MTETRLEPDLLTVEEAAAYLRCHPVTVRRMIATGDLQAARIGGKLLISTAEIKRAIAESSGGAAISRRTQAATEHTTAVTRSR